MHFYSLFSKNKSKRESADDFLPQRRHTTTTEYIEEWINSRIHLGYTQRKNEKNKKKLVGFQRNGFVF